MEGDHDGSCNIQADGSSNQAGSLSTDDFESQLLWSSTDDESQNAFSFASGSSNGQLRSSSNGVQSDTVAKDDQENHFVIADTDEEEEDHSMSDPLTSTIKPSAQTQNVKAADEPKRPPLGDRLARTVTDMLFRSGFTIPWTEERKSTNYCIWEKGIGSSIDLPGTTKIHESHRVEVLRLLLVLLSKSIYVPAHLQISTDNLSLRLITTSLERKKSPASAL